MNFGCKKMKTVIEQILNRRGLLEEFHQEEDFQLRVENEPFMPLTVEKHGKSISITHYFEMNGDIIPDPDMELVIGADGEWYPVAIQFATGHYREARFCKDGKEFVNPREVRDQKQFSNMWAKNIKEQGFITAGI